MKLQYYIKTKTQNDNNIRKCQFNKQNIIQPIHKKYIQPSKKINQNQIIEKKSKDLHHQSSQKLNFKNT